MIKLPPEKYKLYYEDAISHTLIAQYLEDGTLLILINSQSCYIEPDHVEQFITELRNISR